MRIPASEFVDKEGHRWVVNDFAQFDSEVALVPLGDAHSIGRVFIGTDEMRVYFFRPQDARSPTEVCLAVQLASARR